MARDISNSDDVVDSRQVIERIDELESDLQAAHETEGEETSASVFDVWLSNTADDDEHEMQTEALELLALKALQADAEGYAPDWNHGETLIRDTYFQRYAQDLADDMGLMQDKVSWPFTCIDWEQAARELQHDYTSVEWDGVTYWIRA